jgi:uncharacterized protein YjbI with pentapeptide repeats
MSSNSPNPLLPSQPALQPAVPLPLVPASTADPDAALKTKKLELEIDQLSQATSFLERWKSWATLLAAVLAFATFCWTVNAGIKQLNQTQNGQDQDRFDKALTRLGSSSVRERLTGAAGLSLFLTNGQEGRHAATLRFLSSALVIEDDPNVRQAILETFSHVDPQVVSETARRDGLQTLLSLNRSALKAYLKQAPAALASGEDLNPGEPNRAEAIRASARAIAIFIRKGTAERDFSEIDCTDCDLSSPDSLQLDLSEANFRRAVLTNARFSGTKLTRSSFANADLSNTDFEGADLQHASFTGTRDESFVVRQFIITGRRPDPPNFACSNATNADFSGTLFFGVIESPDPAERIAGFPNFFKTDLSGAELSQVGIYALTLKKSKSIAPFDKTKINTYNTRAAASPYGTMQIAESADWEFVPASAPFRRSWQYLLTNLQSATNPDKAYLPVPLKGYRTASAPAQDPSSTGRCDKYSRTQGQ